MTQLVPEVFDFVGDYAEELENNGELLDNFDPEEGLVLFCRDFFNQFFVDQFDVQIVSFSAPAAVDVWVKVADRLSKDDPRSLVVAAFREFCQDYDTIVGEHYDRGGELTAFQTCFVPDLLIAITHWAARIELTRIAEAARIASSLLADALTTVRAIK